MRLICAIFAGVMGAALLGGGTALAQSSDGGTWVNPAFSGAARAERALQFQNRTATQASEELTLGFTLPGTLGVRGRVELGHVSLGPGSISGVMPSAQFGGVSLDPVDQQVGEATIQWNVTPRFQVNTSVTRGLARPHRVGGLPAFEDSVSGEVIYSITPRFAVNARGVMSQSAGLDGQELGEFSGDTAEIGANYDFMPYFTGSVNYTYESFDGETGVLRHDESTLSVSLTGRF